MTDEALKGIAFQAVNMAKRDMLRKEWASCLLASWHEGEQLHRMAKIERLIRERLGEDWLNSGEKKDIAFGLMRTFIQIAPPDAFVFVTAINRFVPTPKLRALPHEEILRILDQGHEGHHQAVRNGLLELQDALAATAQTSERVCMYVQQVGWGGAFIGQPEVNIGPLEDFDGRMKMYGKATKLTAPDFTEEMLRGFK